MGEHTKTPWFISDTVCKTGHVKVSAVGPAGLIATIGNGEITPDKYAANAAFIVKAVNSHDALVKALEFIRDGYDNHDVNHVDYRVKVYQVALEALAALGSHGEGG